MDFYTILDQILALLRQRQRVTYQALQRQFHLDEIALNDLKAELLYAYPQVREDPGRGLVWSGDVDTAAAVDAPPASPQNRFLYTPPYLAEKILFSRSALEGERKQVTVLFTDIKSSMELVGGARPGHCPRGGTGQGASSPHRGLRTCGRWAHSQTPPGDRSPWAHPLRWTAD